MLGDDEVVEVRKIGRRPAKIGKSRAFVEMRLPARKPKPSVKIMKGRSERARPSGKKAETEGDLTLEKEAIFGEETEGSPESGVEGRKKAPSFSLIGEPFHIEESISDWRKIIEVESVRREEASPKNEAKFPIFPFKKFSFRRASSDDCDLKGAVVQDELAPDEGIVEENIFKC